MGSLLTVGGGGPPDPAGGGTEPSGAEPGDPELMLTPLPLDPVGGPLPGPAPASDLTLPGLWLGCATTPSPSSGLMGPPAMEL